MINVVLAIKLCLVFSGVECAGVVRDPVGARRSQLHHRSRGFSAGRYLRVWGIPPGSTGPDLQPHPTPLRDKDENQRGQLPW